MPEPQINPWSNNQSVDVEKLFSNFGIDPIAPVIPRNFLLSRILCTGVLFSDIGITTRSLLRYVTAHHFTSSQDLCRVGTRTLVT